MSKHARKVGADASFSTHQPFSGTDYMKKATDTMFGINRKDANDMASMAERNAQMFKQFSTMTTGNSLLASGNNPWSEMQKLTQTITEHYNRQISKMTEFSNEAMKCHSVTDMMALNAKAMQYFCSDYVNETLKLLNPMLGNELMARCCGFNTASQEICDALGA